jgi:pyruvate/2-oxoglutarate/acetoin dehydrogenase E1 component
VILNNLTNIELNLSTGRYLIVSDDWRSYGCAAEISAQLGESGAKQVKRIACPNRYIPASHHRSDNYYPSAKMIVQAINDMTGKNIPLPPKSDIPHDVDPYVGKVTSLI